MKVGIVVGLIAVVGLGGYGYYSLSTKLEGVSRDYASLSTKLEGVYDDYASAKKVDRALDNLQFQLNGLRGDVVRINGDYAVGQKVDARLNQLQGQIDALRNELAAARQPAPAPPTHVIEIGFRKGDDTHVVLRYSGSSVADAFSRRALTRPNPALIAAVKANEGDAKFGTVTFNPAVLRSPEGSRTVALGGDKPPACVVHRSTPTNTDWDLTREIRTEIATLLSRP